MELTSKDQSRLQRAQLARTMRKEMGMKAGVMAQQIGVLQSNYCKMEQGMQNLSDERYNKIEAMFVEWRNKEAKRLLAHIQYLYGLTGDVVIEDDTIKFVNKTHKDDKPL